MNSNSQEAERVEGMVVGCSGLGTVGGWVVVVVVVVSGSLRRRYGRRSRVVTIHPHAATSR